ncbi:hypothetical protein [Cytophaga hutchinsonii]|uniref:Uncharacterized protein n=1 Tax=Cytophaga hutchinsonii (strain ATCC 33406 / DSM 1761 / CIP 103989 / NBRC 15051 / NCIMB 9469 / D465) TaxID=269798 RepID=A0A6N4SXN1_CYTH3|nr:hypothetical protein [Cytophaga hutchinsonii]ABG60981.1 conserved hypothetical protein [Cytophaga hutchinsonii ATCC 33406]
MIILLANCFFILYSIMFFTDHKFIPKETGGRIRNALLLCLALYVSYNVLFIYILKKENEQSGIIYKIASGIKYVSINSYTFIEPFQKEFIISLVIAAAIMMVSFILLGMPGGLIIGLLQKMGIGNNIQGDNVWPAALYVSLIWPLCFPIAVLTKNHLIQQGHIDYALLSLYLSGFLWVTVVISSTFLLFGNSPRF